MCDFNQWLRDALMDANLLDFETVLADADAQAFHFSPRYCRERMRMLADPSGWAKRHSRSVWNRMARNIACVLLACTVAFGALMAVSPTVRAAVLNWLREFRGDTVAYSSSPYVTDPAPEDAAPQDWRITWLPEEYALQNIFPGPGISKWFFLSAASGNALDFGCSAPGGDSMFQSGLVPDPEGVRESVMVRGCTADYYAGGTDQLLVWENPEGFLLRLTVIGQMDRDTLVKIAESVACYGDNTPAYEMSWAPPDFHDLGGLYGNGAYRQEWVRRGVLLSWQYVIDPVCPFAAPEGEPEEVTVNGLPGRYWACREEFPETPDEPGGSTEVSNGVTIIAGTSFGADTSNTLMWEDPETGTAFCLTGELDKSDMLRMAESVKRKEASDGNR